MDKETKENWERIKLALEEAEKTDTEYYRRAVAIVGGSPDPVEHP